jgi:hypothetical protein
MTPGANGSQKSFKSSRVILWVAVAVVVVVLVGALYAGARFSRRTSRSTTPASPTASTLNSRLITPTSRRRRMASPYNNLPALIIAASPS